MNTYQNLVAKIKAFLEKELEEVNSLHISSLKALSKGWETDLFAFDMFHDNLPPDNPEKLIIRIFPSYDLKKRAKWEYDVLLALHNVGYPVPKVHYLGIENNSVGKPFIIMERIVGKDQGELFFSLIKENKQHQVKDVILPILSKLFANLHKIDWKILPICLKKEVSNDPFYFINNKLSVYEKEIKRYGFVSLNPILQWLKERKFNASCKKLSIIHRDFHPHNLIVSENKKVYVVDWAGSCVGDFRSDLAWTLILMYAYTNKKFRDLFLKFYEKEYGSTIDSIEYFEVLAILRRFLDVMRIIQHGPKSIGMREESINQIRETIFHLANIFNLLIERTKLELIELENWVKTVSNRNKFQ